MAMKIGGSKIRDRNTVDALLMVDPATTPGQQPVGQSGWALVQSEEFTGTMSVTDSVKGFVKFRDTGYEWSTWYPEWQMFVDDNPTAKWHTNTNYDAYYDTSKVSLDGAGSLLLKCDKQAQSGCNYTAGMIQSLPNSNYLYGYFEARIKIATQGVTGHWPAWWVTSSATNTWPPEIDIWEYFGDASGSYWNNTFLQSGTYSSATSTTTTAWHTYGCKWTSTSVTWYRDGAQTNTIGSTGTPTSAQYLIVNNGSQKSASPVFTANDMWVDYIRVWQ